MGLSFHLEQARKSEVYGANGNSTGAEMKPKIVCVCAALALASPAAVTPAAARGCIKGALIGGIGLAVASGVFELLQNLAR